MLGFTLVAGWDEPTAHLAWIGILPESRSRGYGQHLLHDTMVTCREQGAERMSLYTDVSTVGRTLYERLGFRPAGTLTYRRRTPSAADAA